MNTSYLFRKLLGTVLAILLLMGVVSAPVFAEPTRQDDETMPVHLIIGVDGDWSAIAVNRSSWDDFSITNGIHSGMALQSRDYVEVSGDNALIILCSDLSTTELFANGVPECETADTPAFMNMDKPVWSFENEQVLVGSDALVMPDDLANSDMIPVLADEATRTEVGDILTNIAGLGLDDSTLPYVSAYALASRGFYLDAVNAMLTSEDLQCSDRRNFVEVSDGNSVYENPSVYLRMGEWYAILGNPEVSTRYLQCAVDLAETNGDALSAGLGYSRLAAVSDDAEQRTAYYQTAIEAFNSLSADAAVESLLDTCGSANCTAP